MARRGHYAEIMWKGKVAEHTQAGKGAAFPEITESPSTATGRQPDNTDTKAGRGSRYNGVPVDVPFGLFSLVK